MKNSNKLLLGLLGAIMLGIVFSAWQLRIFLKENFKDFDETDVVEQVRTVQAFDKLEASTGVIIFSQSNETEVKVKANNAFIDYIFTDVEDKLLTIRYNRSMPNYRKDEIHITNPELKSVKILAGSTFSTTGEISAKEFTVEGRTGSSINISGNFEVLHIELGAGANATFSGSTSKLYIDSRTGSSLNAEQLFAEDVEVSAGAGASVNIQASQTLSVNASTGSRVQYSGNPQVEDVNISTGAVFSKK